MNETLKVSLKNRRGELKRCPDCKKKPEFATWSDGRMEIRCTECSEPILTNRPYSVFHYPKTEKDFHRVMDLAIISWNNACTYISNISKAMKRAKSAS